MPPLTRDQRTAIAGFVDLTGELERVAQRYLKNTGYRLNDAVEAYFQSGGGNSAAKDGPLNNIFDKHQTGDDSKDSLGAESAMGYLQGLGANLEDASSFLALEIIQAPQFAEINRQKFVEGWKKTGAEATEIAHQTYFRRQNIAMSTDRDLFKRVYRNVFIVGKEEDQKALSKDVATVYWDMLFKAPGQPWIGNTGIDWLAEWKSFLEEKWTRSVSKDMWNQTLEFAFKSREDDTLGFWSEDGAWPGVIDDFVAWYKAKSTMDVDS